MEIPLFEQVGELVRSLVPGSLGPVRYRSHRRGVKVWLGGEQAPRHHYEAQLIPRRLVDDLDGAALEIGFHAEDWRRVSETWIEPDLDDEDLAFELASRLADYVTNLQPLLEE